MSFVGQGGEIITLQFGNVSNYVGTHYWNFQDELLGRQSLCALPDNEVFDFEKLYCVSSREIYFPRALIFDLRGRLGSYNPCRETIEVSDFVLSTWDQQVQVSSSSAVIKNKFLSYLEQEEKSKQKGESTDVDYPDESCLEHDNDSSDESEVGVADSDVFSWTDFLKAKFHREAVIELPIHENSLPFQAFSAGLSTDVMSTSIRDVYFDSFRHILEECDSIYAVNVLGDIHDGFSGFAASFLQDIRDELPRVVLPVWAFTDTIESRAGCGHDRELSPFQQHNLSLFYAHSTEWASVIIPQTTKYQLSCGLVQSEANIYHSSAILSSSVDTLMSSYCISGATPSVTDIYSLVARLKVGCSLPFAETRIRLADDTFEDQSTLLLTPKDSLFPVYSTSDGEFLPGKTAPLLVTRGLSSHICSKISKKEVLDITQNRLYAHRNVSTHLPIPLSFPDIFYEKNMANLCSSHESDHRSLQKIERPMGCTAVSTIGCSSKAVGYLEEMSRLWKSRCRKSSHLMETVEDTHEILEKLEQIFSENSYVLSSL